MEWEEADKLPGKWSGRRPEHISTNPSLLGMEWVQFFLSLGVEPTLCGSVFDGWYDVSRERMCPGLGRGRRKTFKVTSWLQVTISLAKDFAV